ncbi:zinc-binding dehydrogenase [Kitasatospora sp. NPDC018058]|uniref:zinc-binding dehydrogenase n=1 Tax=Kitasatospora sp. NPDC018058 TaxID=3364025 RepID=UPI0037BFAA1D
MSMYQVCNLGGALSVGPAPVSMSRPLIDRVFDLAETVEAHRRTEATGQVGKLVVTVRH